MMTNERLASIINTEFANSLGRPSGEISKEREIAWSRYNRELLGNEPPEDESDQSRVVTSEVAEVVDGIMPSLLRIFTIADNVVDFDPVGPEDVEQAQQQSDYVNHVFFKDNDSYLITYSWMFDALLQKLGKVEAYWDERETITEDEYEGQTLEQITLLDEDPEVEIIAKDERTELVPVQGLEEPLEFTVYDIRIRRVTKMGCVKVECFPPEEFRISADANSVAGENARMQGRERLLPRSELIDMGFDPDQVNDLPAEKTQSEEKLNRQPSSDEQDDKNHGDKSQDLICFRKAYIRVDFDEDGRSELREVCTGGGKILRLKDGEDANRVVSRHPFHTLSAKPLPHKHFGKCPGEDAIDLMETNTTLWRQVLNNLYQTNNPGHAVWEQAMTENTLDDLMTTKLGQIRRFGRPVGEAYSPMTVPFTAGATFPVIEYLEKVKRDRTGVSSDSEGLSPESLKNIQTSVLAQAFDQSRMKLEAIARTFAETGFKSLFLHIDELIRTHQDVPRMVELRNKWVEVDPRRWKARNNITVNVGLGMGTREQNLLHLNAIWEKQAQMWQGEGRNLTVMPKHMYNTAAEIVKNANFKVPGMFFNDPGDALAPPLADEAQQLQEMQAQLQARQQELDARDQEIKQQKVALDAQRMTFEHQREVARLQEQAAAREDKFLLENEKLQTEVSKLMAELRTKAVDNQETRARTAKLEAETDQIRSE